MAVMNKMEIANRRVGTKSQPTSSNLNPREFKKAIRVLFGGDRDQKNLTADGLEACRRTGIKPEELVVKTLQDFMENPGDKS